VLDAASVDGEDVLREIRVAVAAFDPLAASQASYDSVIPDAAGAARLRR
jgi:hypothetical protein